MKKVIMGAAFADMTVNISFVLVAMLCLLPILLIGTMPAPSFEPIR